MLNKINSELFFFKFNFQKASSRQLAVEDIDDPQAYSIEDAKLKAEHDKMVREAEAKKALERKKIHQLRKTFLDLRHKNNDLPDSVKLLKEVSLHIC